MTSKLQAEQVAAWLRERPDFFVTRPELLSELRIPHASGAVSLLEYQMQLLREENAKLRELCQSASHNDRLFAAMRKLTLALLAASCLDELLQETERCLREEFQVSHVRLMLFNESPLPLGAGVAQCSIKQAKTAIGSLLKGDAQLCSALRDNELNFLFGEHHSIKSAAVLPLRGDSLYGLLALGSPDTERYRGTLGTLFLDYLGEVLPCLLKRFLSVPAH